MLQYWKGKDVLMIFVTGQIIITEKWQNRLEIWSKIWWKFNRNANSFYQENSFHNLGHFALAFRGWFNIKTSYQYRKSHCGDKMILRPSYHHNGISYTGKITFLYWIRAQDVYLDHVAMGISNVSLCLTLSCVNEYTLLSHVFCLEVNLILPFVHNRMAWHHSIIHSRGNV